MTNEIKPGIEAEEVESRIIAFVKRELLGPGIPVSLDEDLLSGGLLDSLGALRLATFVEEEFQITVQPSDFVIENFRSVAALAEYVRRSSGREGAGAPDTGN
jgi:acyl carrier protein